MQQPEAGEVLPPEPGIGLRPFEWAMGIVFCATFAPAWFALASVWSRLDYYSHGYLVPFAALWAASAQRHLLPRLPITRRSWGALVFAGALVVYALARAASIISLQGVAIIIALAGLIGFARGEAWLRALRFPLAYLVFMIPIPEPWLNPVIARLQIFVSGAAIEILHVFSLPVLREGNVMLLPSGESLFVAEACSGITSIVTLIPLAVFLAYFTERRFSRQVVLVASVIPLAMLGNLLRVVGTVAGAERFGVQRVTDEAIHGWAGMLTYVLGCLALLAVSSVMRRFWPVEKPLAP